MMKNTMLEMSRYAALARQAVAEGIVLLKNEAVLPLASGGRAALFGYAQFHYYQSGTGAGGLVNTAHVPNLPEVLGGPDGYQLDAEVQACAETAREQCAEEVEKLAQLQKMWALRKPILDAHILSLQGKVLELEQEIDEIVMERIVTLHWPR